MHTLLPGATWTAAGIGREQLRVARWAIQLGGHCRTGLEDNIRLDKHRLAPSNAALVRQIADLATDFGCPIATSQQAREILRLGQAIPASVSGPIFEGVGG